MITGSFFVPLPVTSRTQRPVFGHESRPWDKHVLFMVECPSIRSGRLCISGMGYIQHSTFPID